MDEQRVKRAVEEFRRVALDLSLEDAFRAALEAADREPGPVWPSDESVEAYRRAAALAPCAPPCAPDSYTFLTTRSHLRAALLRDPILRAAVAYVVNAGAGRVLEEWRALRAAVEASGLTPEDLP